jgi:hypothetical protein
MTTDELTARLMSVIDGGDLISETEELVDELQSENCGLDEVRCILVTMEQHPKIDFGAPGPLVHWIERFYNQGYETLLLDSIGRQPTRHTVWMLNRIINGTKNKEERAKFVGALKSASESDKVDEATREVALHFLSLHT